MGHHIMRTYRLNQSAALQLILREITPLPVYFILSLAIKHDWEKFDPEIDFAYQLFNALQTRDVVKAFNYYQQQAIQSQGLRGKCLVNGISTHRVLSLFQRYQPRSAA